MNRCEICECDLDLLDENEVYSCQECGLEVCCECISEDFLTCVNCRY